MHSIQIAGQTDVGQRRTDNQDTFICTTIWSDSSVLLAVIDGVGGYAGGEQAAAIARESIERYMTKPNGDPLSMLREAVVFANNQINEQRQQEARLAQMCCVLTVAVANADTGKLYFVHVGDTRLYRYRQGVLEKLTHDHSLVGIREDANELTEVEAMQHPRRNEIMREVGSTEHRVDDPDFLESGETDFRSGDQLLLCSDGLTDMITQAQITSVLRQSAPLEKQAAELIKLANQQGGNDNITVVLATNTAESSESPAPVTTKTTQLVDTTTREVPVQPVAPSKAETAAKSSTSSSMGWWVAGFLVLVGVIGLLWYTFQPPDPTDSEISRSVAASAQDVNSQSDTASAQAKAFATLDSLVKVAYRNPDHQLQLANYDTIRLSKPLLLTDSLGAVLGHNRLTVIVPADTAQSSVAFRVIQRKNVKLENLVIYGFKTGIETTGQVQLQLNQVYFRNVDVPISAAVQQDTLRNTLISVSLQPQPVSVQPKPSRP
jgi:serine/threonine protein phosphatase PrpC